jgi:dienelactone hydrolase
MVPAARIARLTNGGIGALMDAPQPRPRPNYATLPSLQRVYDTAARRLAFRARTRDEWAEWHRELSGRLIDLLGGFPPDRPPLDAVRLEVREEADYRLERVAFQSEPGVDVPCHVLIPRHVAPPYRPVIALHGHGTGGAAHLFGAIVNEATRAEEEGYIRSLNYDYGRQLGRRGFMVFAPTQRGFGERTEAGLEVTGGLSVAQSRCRAISLNAMLLGKTAIGLRVWDVMRTVDYIRSRPEPMVAGIGCLGLSGGGTTTLFATAVEPRITAAVVSGYFNTFHDSIMAIFHCECNYIPGIVRDAEMADVAGLIAPRPLLIEMGTEDHIFPVRATEAAYRELRRVYELLGASDRLDKDIFPGAHEFSGRKAFAWLTRWLA